MREIFLVAAFITLLPAAPAAVAATVYKTVDENGVVSFSDVPPENAEQAEVLTIKTPPAAGRQDYEQQLEQMRETTDRMAADRREREQHRAALRSQQRVASTSPAARTTNPAPAYPATPIFNSGWIPGAPVWRPPYRPPGRPLPVRPPHRYPIPPGANVNLGGNSQLMRPIVSRRR